MTVPVFLTSLGNGEATEFSIRRNFFKFFGKTSLAPPK
jgi:hypothetical protein